MGPQKICRVFSSIACLLWPSNFGCLSSRAVDFSANSDAGSCHHSKCCPQSRHGGSLLQVGRARFSKASDANASDQKVVLNEAAEYRSFQSGGGRSIAIGSAAGSNLTEMPALAFAGKGPAKTNRKNRSVELEVLEERRRLTQLSQSKVHLENAVNAYRTFKNRVINTLSRRLSAPMPEKLEHWSLLVRISDAMVIVTIVLLLCIIASSFLVLRNTGVHFDTPLERVWGGSSKPFESAQSPLMARAAPRGVSQRMSSLHTFSSKRFSTFDRLPSPSIITTASSGFSGSAQCLCPNLVVPNGNECFLATPTLQSVGLPPNNSAMFAVRDMHGSPVILVEVCEVSWGNVGDHARTPPAVVLRQTKSQATTSSAAPPLLAYCKPGREVEGRRSMFFYDPANVFSAYITRDASKGCYLLTSARMGLQLMFFGNFGEHAVSVVNEVDEKKAALLVTTEPAEVVFDAQKTYVKIRASSGVDVGLILCGLLSINLMERE